MDTAALFGKISRDYYSCTSSQNKDLADLIEKAIGKVNMV